MKPTLFPAGETAFTSNGLGRLSPIMCRVTHERNGQFDLEMDIRIDDKHFADLAEEKIIYAPFDNTGVCQPFDIYKITKAMEGVVTVYANHVYYRTVKTTVMPCSALSCAASMQAVENSVVGDEMFELTTDMTTQGRFEVNKPQPMRNILFGQRGSLLDVYGGEFVFDHFRIHLSSAAGSEKNVTLRYGKNLTKLKKTTDASNVWTGIVPYWIGSEGTDQELVTLPEEVIYANTVTNHPYKMVIPVDLSSRFSEKPSVEALRAAATQYVNSNVKTAIPSSMDVSFIQLWETEEYKNIANLERVSLCDTISIEHAQLGVSVKAKITKTVYDVINERYESMTIGDVRAGLGATIEAAANAVEEKAVSKTALQAALEAATKLINGGLGGHVVNNTDDNGHPNEILVMDQPDKAAAVNVIRVNKNGIGFSQNGYAGPFNSAWTIDGRFVADYITAGTLNAAIIKAGILTDSAGKNFWDMTTGEFSLSANSTVGGRTVSNIATSAASSAVNGQTQQSIFNKLTNNGQTQGIYLKNGKVYLNFTYAEGGTLKLGSANNGNGILEIYDANDVKIGEWKNDGLTQTKEMRMWKTVPSGMSVVTEDCKMHQNESIIRWMLGSKYAGFIGTQYWPYGYDGTLSEDDLCLNVLGGNHLSLGLACNSSGSAVDTGGTFKGEIEVIDISYNDNLRSGVTVSINEPIHLHSDGIVCYGGGFYNSSWNKTSGAGFYFESGNSEIAVVRGKDVKINAYNGKAYYNDVEIATESSSSIRYKHDIKPIEEDTDLDPHRLLDLRVVQFKWNNDHPLQHEDMRERTVPGIIAEDVEEIYPSAVIHKDGKVESWDERRLIPGMLALIQEQDKKIQLLEERLATIERAWKEMRC